tara:strand:+ start:4564 stop:5742 length:1179 start_codon:yes stop_codon:yes gene_type:complete
MTVRVNKQPFNIREKLSELERPIGVKGHELMAAETAQDVRDLVSAGRKNMVINGDMRIDQRYNGSSRDISNGAEEYVVDRFLFREQVSTTVRVQRNALSASTDPPGFRYAVKCSTLGSDTSISNTEYARIQQYIETNNLKCDWGIHNTDYLTLSFWVKSSVPGKYHVNLEDGDASPLYLKPYYINQADTWQKVELTYPPPSSGSWTTSTDNGIGMRITWSLTIGSNYVSGLDEGWTTSYHMAGPDQVNFADTAGNAFWLTGVQLERGRNATEFEHRPYGEELSLCQRYYGKIRLSNQEWIYNEASTSNHKWHHVYIPFSMRANPTIDASDLTMGGGVSGLSGTLSSYLPQQPGDTPGRISSRVGMTVNSGTAYSIYHTDQWNGDYISVDAEL